MVRIFRRNRTLRQKARRALIRAYGRHKYKKGYRVGIKSTKSSVFRRLHLIGYPISFGAGLFYGGKGVIEASNFNPQFRKIDRLSDKIDTFNNNQQRR